VCALPLPPQIKIGFGEGEWRKENGMECDEFVNAVRLMREAQKNYIRLHNQSALRDSFKWEEVVDQALREGITKEIIISEDELEMDMEG